MRRRLILVLILGVFLTPVKATDIDEAVRSEASTKLQLLAFQAQKVWKDLREGSLDTDSFLRVPEEERVITQHDGYRTTSSKYKLLNKTNEDTIDANSTEYRNQFRKLRENENSKLNTDAEEWIKKLCLHLNECTVIDKL